MAVRASTLAGLLALWAIGCGTASAQSMSVEFDGTTGFSTEGDTAAAGAQLRVFGELPREYRVNVEATWADRTADVSDAFGAAYPYGGRVSAQRGVGRTDLPQQVDAARRPRRVSSVPRSASTRAATTPTRASCGHR